MNGEIVNVNMESECKRIEHLRFRKVKLKYGSDDNDIMKCITKIHRTKF